MDGSKFYTVREIADILRIGINKAYDLTNQKDFPSIRIGSAIRIEREAFENWVRNQTHKIIL